MATARTNPADIPKLLAALDGAGIVNLQLVAGYRRKRRDTWLKRLSSRVANGVRASLLGDATPDTGCGLKLILRSAYLELPFFDHMHRFLPALVQRNGGATLSVEVNHRARARGVSKLRAVRPAVDRHRRHVRRDVAAAPRQTPAGDRAAQALKIRTYLPGLVFLVTLIAIGYLVESGLLRGMLSEAWIDREVRGQGIPGELLFVAAGGIVTALAVRAT